MKTLTSAVAVLALSVTLIGCSKEASVKKQTTVKGPEGTTTTTTETTVETSGKNPPAPGGAQVPNP